MILRPLLYCGHRYTTGGACGKVYDERDARRAERGRWRGTLVAPVCHHPLHHAVYVDPRKAHGYRYRRLRAYAT